MFDSLRPRGLYSPWNSPDENTGVGRLSLLQGIFLTQEIKLSSPVSPALQVASLTWSHWGSPRLSAYPKVTGFILVLCCLLHMVLVLSPHAYRVAAIAQTSHPFSHTPNKKEGSK